MVSSGKQAKDAPHPTGAGLSDNGAREAVIATTASVAAQMAGHPIVLVGMMGAGKTTVGRRLAHRLGWHFVDSDTEIETAAGMSIPDFFEAHGEAEFRSGEAKVIARLLNEKNCVLGTGGGAFMHPQTRQLIAQMAVSVWIKADFDVLFARVSKRANRPLLKTANPRETLKKLLAEREPTYALADLSITSRDIPHEEVVDAILIAIDSHLRSTDRRFKNTPSQSMPAQTTPAKGDKA